jgi:hypothetical protein
LNLVKKIYWKKSATLPEGAITWVNFCQRPASPTLSTRSPRGAAAVIVSLIFDPAFGADARWPVLEPFIAGRIDPGSLGRHTPVGDIGQVRTNILNTMVSDIGRGQCCPKFDRQEQALSCRFIPATARDYQ